MRNRREGAPEVQEKCKKTRALSVADLLNKKYKLFEFDGKWFEAFSKPEAKGVWFIWGNSGNGKTSFVLQLIKYLAGFVTVAYNSLEEGGTHTMQEAFRRTGMIDVARKVILIEGESMKELEERMNKHKSPVAYVIDSLQYSGLTYIDYKALKERHRDKLLIFISHAEGKQPEGRSAKKIMYDAGLKIWIEGYKAISKGRYIGPNGGTFTIWEEGAAKYWD
ncbi:MAG: hypothetical protein CVT94_19195 [Bacteroidetes bacterium HGW-Bacteroidetes-11]|nr:MAG: hypothetical protein CVT94_19195 [Bacteroidetes bacterium HGW-Bacteroidetes-11]